MRYDDEFAGILTKEALQFVAVLLCCARDPLVVANQKVEIHGPAERKMIIKALNSDAKVFMV